MKHLKICLNLIVKNETKVLKRCFDSIIPFIDCWLIVDTGSTDGTQKYIIDYFANHNIPGNLIERPWQDFAHNRTEAFQLASKLADYVWIIDADEQLNYDKDFKLPELKDNVYQLLHKNHNSTVEFYRTQIIRSNLPFRYEGVLHEVAVCDAPHQITKLPGIVSIGYFDSARNHNPLMKYKEDAEILKKALIDNPNNDRYVFYLAQSYRDSNQLELAIETYARRVSMGGWGEEQWCAAFQMAIVHERLGHQLEAINSYLKAYALRPIRAESIYELSRYYREHHEFQLGHFFAKQAIQIPKPNDILFLDEAVYSWKALDEYSICAYYVGDNIGGFMAIEDLLNGKVPAQHRERVELNRKFFVQRLKTIT